MEAIVPHLPYKNLACAQISIPISDLLLMKTHGCATVVLMWQALHDKFEGEPHMCAVNIQYQMMQKRAETSDTMCTHLDEM